MDKPKSQNSKAKGSGTPASPAPKPAAPPPAPLRPPPLFRRIDWFTFAVTTLLVCAGYFLTLSPDLTLEDSGELAVASFYAGIPHPPGYPVWTLYTWFWTVILPFSNIAWRVSVGVAVASAVACGLLGLLVSRGSSMMMEGIAELKDINRRWENAICVVAGFVAGMLLGFNGYMWSQSVIVEVYGFSLVSFMGVLVCLLRWIYAPHQRRYLYWSFFLFGICFTNHQTLIVAAMGIEVAIAAADFKMGRALFLWNSIVYVAGLILKSQAMLFTNTNPMVFAIFNIVGLLSIAAYVWFLVRTNETAAEMGRDAALALGVALLCYVPTKGGPLLVLALLPLGLFGWLAWNRRKHGLEWLVGLNCGLLWGAGAAFYLYMALAGMSIPPMQWGYPRTVEGFFHALSRGQYEKTNPTDLFSDPMRFLTQLGMLFEGVLEEFNWVYSLLALVPLLFFLRMQKREKAWMIGLASVYLCMGVLLLILINPPPDRQARELIRVFFTASHVIVAIFVGYGITLITATLATHYDRFRTWFLAGGAIATAFALYSLTTVIQEFFAGHGDRTGFSLFSYALTQSFSKDQYALPIFAGLILIGMALVFFLAVLLKRTNAPVGVALVIFALMPLHSIMSHWFENEQRGHLFGYWFGHDMFTPPFTAPDGTLSYDPKLRAELMKDPAKAKFIYPEMTRDAILYGGTDPGRFCPTYTIFCESFIPARCKPRDPLYDRRDVYIITQNALADGTYLNYIRSHYNRSTQFDPPFFQELLRSTKERELNYTTNFLARIACALLDRPLTAIGAKIEARRRREGVYPKNEMHIATPDDSQRCFSEYLADAQKRLDHDAKFPNEPRLIKPGEDVRIIENRVQVSGQIAVMAINGLITKVMFDKNPTNEFFVEESFPLDWMYPHLTPFGIIMKINRQPLPTLTEDILARDHYFWSQFAQRLIGTNVVTYDTPVKDIVDFVEKVYLRHDFSGYQGDRKFVRDDQAQKAFSKLRSSISGVYAWRLGPYCPPEFRPKTPEEYERIRKECDFAFRQAFAFCPYSPEAVFRYVNLLLQYNRIDDALLIAKTCQKLDPYNAGVIDLINRLTQFKNSASEMEKARANFQAMENEWRANPSNIQLGLNLASTYLSLQQTNRAMAVFDRILQETNVDANAVLMLARIYVDMGNWAKLEAALEKLVKVMSENAEAWYDLAALKASVGKPPESIAALTRALDLDAKRKASGAKTRDLMAEARKDPRFTAIRQTPEFQKLVPPQ